jgi:hypothetical protein
MYRGEAAGCGCWLLAKGETNGKGVATDRTDLGANHTDLNRFLVTSPFRTGIRAGSVLRIRLLVLHLAGSQKPAASSQQLSRPFFRRPRF